MAGRTIVYHQNIAGKDVYIHKPGVATVDLIACTTMQEETVTKIIRTYRGDMENRETFPEEREQAFKDAKSTMLGTPAEMISYVWLIRNVTRAFTHQLVRSRIGTSFAQESMRFYGAKKEYHFLASGDVLISNNLNKYAESIFSCVECYEYLIATGVKSQDARGILPTNILTHIYFGCTMRALQKIFNDRVCCQAQGDEWIPLLLEMREQIKIVCGDKVSSLLTAPVERGESCGYNASFDRSCIWKKGIPK